MHRGWSHGAPAASSRRRPRGGTEEAFIAAFKKVKSGEKLPAADKKANEAAFTELDKFMDFDALTTKPIEPRAAKFSARQKEEFASKFTDAGPAHGLPRFGRLLPRAPS